MEQLSGTWEAEQVLRKVSQDLDSAIPRPLFRVTVTSREKPHSPRWVAHPAVVWSLNTETGRIEEELLKILDLGKEVLRGCSPWLRRTAPPGGGLGWAERWF